MRSKTLGSSFRVVSLNGDFIAPRAKISTASSASWRLPTYDPLMVMVWTTVLNTEALKCASAGRPIATTVPLGRTYSVACWNGFSAAVTRRTACAPEPPGVRADASLTTSWDLV